MLNFFRKQSLQDLQKQARSDYEKVSTTVSNSSELAVLRLKISSLCKAHIDKTFIDGAESTRIWQDACALSLTQGTASPNPPLPKSYHLVKMASSDDKIWTWIPESYTQEIFNLGKKYQLMAITADTAIDQTQKIADNICKNDLKLDNSFTVLQFLRDELENEGFVD